MPFKVWKSALAAEILLLLAALGLLAARPAQYPPQPGPPADYAITPTGRETYISLPPGRWTLIATSLADPPQSSAISVAWATSPIHPQHLAPCSPCTPGNLVRTTQPLHHRRPAGPTPVAPPHPVATAPADPIVPRPWFDLPASLSPAPGDPATYTRISARIIEQTASVCIWADATLPESPALVELAREVAQRIESSIAPRTATWLGPAPDIDGSGRLDVLITPALDRLASGSRPLLGCVRPDDFRPHVVPPFGNQRDVLYLNPRIDSRTELHAVLAHEYTHAVTLGLRDESHFSPQHDWLSEAAAHVAEEQHGAGWTNLHDRLSAFLAAPETSPLMIRDARAAGRFRDPGCRGAGFLFLRWVLRTHPDATLRAILAHPEPGLAAIADSARRSPDDLLRDWLLALVHNRDDVLPKTLHLPPMAQRRLSDSDSAALTLCVAGSASALIVLENTGNEPRTAYIGIAPDSRWQLTLTPAAE